MSTDNLRNLIDLVEAKGHQDLVLDYHYGELAKGYVDRYNKGEGDATFNEAGAYLHNIFFPQLMPVKSGNKPNGASLALINRKFGSFDKFKDAVKVEAMKIQGSGWIYMSRSGDIKTIKNHQKRNDIALLIDMWEHAFNKDYGSNKSKYLDNIWRIIDWNKVNIRIYSGK